LNLDFGFWIYGCALRSFLIQNPRSKIQIPKNGPGPPAFGSFSLGEQRKRTFKIDNIVKSQKNNLFSFRRKPESSNSNMFWMPDQVRHDGIRLFTGASKFR